MNLEALLPPVLSFTGTFSLHLIILLFLICAIGELGASVPYLLETIWLLSGYHLGNGALMPSQLVLLWLAAQGGRQTGATALYSLSRFGSLPLIKLYHRFFKTDLSEKLANSNSLPVRLFRRLNLLSPFSIALGRLLWLRIPLTLTLGVKRQGRILSLGVLLSSLVWDSIYILLGIVGASAVLKPSQMVLYSLAGLTLLYVVSFVIQRLLRLRLNSGA